MIKGNYGTAVMLEGEPNTRYLLPTNLVADYYNVTNNLVGTSAITNFTGEETDAAYFTYDYVTPWQFDHITFNTRVRRGFAYLKLPYDEFKNVSIVEMVDNINAVAKGDVNGDGVVNGSDVTALYNVLLDNAIPGGDADVNGDGVVNGSDVTALYNLLLEQ
ncbi:MAG: dockerin type I repeat-containing protein [Muribaculaceae bacterium]|nr:dockerin type I repeat-containing protein [Muribaculaceae bacterium]